MLSVVLKILPSWQSAVFMLTMSRGGALIFADEIYFGKYRGLLNTLKVVTRKIFVFVDSNTPGVS